MVSTVKELAEVLDMLIGDLLETCDDECGDLPTCGRCQRMWRMRDRLTNVIEQEKARSFI